MAQLRRRDSRVLPHGIAVGLQQLQYQSFEPGQAIYRAAEAPNRFFVVLSGTVDLYQPKHETPEEIARAK